MPVPPPTAGWNRLLVKSKFSFARDFSAVDPSSGELRYSVKSSLGFRLRAQIRDASGVPLFAATGKVMTITRQITVADARGAHVAHLKDRPLSPLRDKVDISLADGERWLLKGDLMEKNYTVTAANGEAVIAITQKWVTVLDAYTVDVRQDVEPGLALAIVWALDRWVEQSG